jgi:hypothetical protein
MKTLEQKQKEKVFTRIKNLWGDAVGVTRVASAYASDSGPGEQSLTRIDHLMNEAEKVSVEAEVAAEGAMVGEVGEVITPPPPAKKAVPAPDISAEKEDHDAIDEEDEHDVIDEEDEHDVIDDIALEAESKAIGSIGTMVEEAASSTPTPKKAESYPTIKEKLERLAELNPHADDKK